MTASHALMCRYERMAATGLKDGLEGRATCRFCGAPREYVDEDIGIGIPVGYPLECDCVSRIYAEAADQRRAERADAGYEARVARSNVPALFLDAKTELPVASAYIYGGPGTGKTHNACGILMKAMRQGMSALYVTMSGLSGKGFDDREALFERMRRVDVLCIDDLGKAETGEWGNALAFRAIDERYGTGKALVVTSNYDSRGLAERLAAGGNSETAEATVSRLYGMMEGVRLEGRDRRLTR